MDPEKFKEKTKKVAGTTNVDVISTEYLNPDYEIEVLPNKLTTSSGLLEVARLDPVKPGLPKFVFRWDENADVLDVDIYKDGKYRNDLWNENEYKGHHTQRISNGGKIFEADISSFDQPIFKGEIDIGLFIQLTIKDSVNLTDSIKVVHKRIKIEDFGKGENHITVNERSKN